MWMLRSRFSLNYRLNGHLNHHLNGDARLASFWNAAPERVAENRILEENVV